jgi:hypothetical protein
LNVYWHDGFPDACSTNTVGILGTREDAARVSELSFDRHGDRVRESR